MSVLIALALVGLAVWWLCTPTGTSAALEATPVGFERAWAGVASSVAGSAPAPTRPEAALDFSSTNGG